MIKIKSAQQSIKEMISTPQYQKDILIMEAFSEYKSLTHHELLTKRILKALKINQNTFNKTVAGSTKIDISQYNQLLNYIQQAINQVRSNN